MFEEKPAPIFVFVLKYFSCVDRFRITDTFKYAQISNLYINFSSNTPGCRKAELCCGDLGLPRWRARGGGWVMARASGLRIIVLCRVLQLWHNIDIHKTPCHCQYTQNSAMSKRHCNKAFWHGSLSMTCSQINVLHHWSIVEDLKEHCLRCQNWRILVLSDRWPEYEISGQQRRSSMFPTITVMQPSHQCQCYALHGSCPTENSIDNFNWIYFDI